MTNIRAGMMRRSGDAEDVFGFHECSHFLMSNLQSSYRELACSENLAYERDRPCTHLNPTAST